MGTSTSSFGVGRRESHDSTDFYARFAPPEISTDDVIGAPGELDVIHVGDARDMSAVPDASVALVVTSPPYFAGKQYETALGEGHVPADYIDYLTMLRDVLAESVRTLEPGGRIAVNVANLGRRPYRNLAADVTTILQDDLRLLLRGEVVWQKQRGASGSCAWGSYQSPANPVLRDTSERVIIASKGRFDRVGRPAGPATIPGDEFMEATLDIWEIPAESATRVGHPAPFPVALVERCLHLLTYEGDIVLDPFMGSGTTAVAAVNTGRRYIGYDTDAGYVRQARERVASLPATRPARAAHAEGAGEGAARRRRLHRRDRGGEGVARRHGQLRRGRARRRAAAVRTRWGAHAGPRRAVADRGDLAHDRQGVDRPSDRPDDRRDRAHVRPRPRRSARRGRRRTVARFVRWST